MAEEEIKMLFILSNIAEKENIVSKDGDIYEATIEFLLKEADYSQEGIHHQTRIEQ